MMNEPAHWAKLIRGVRVEGDTVVITVNLTGTTMPHDVYAANLSTRWRINT
jgi:hypothetical protein